MIRGHPEQGYILVAVLGAMLLLTGFMAAGSVFIRSALDTARVSDAETAIAGLTQGGLEITAYQLFVIHASLEAIDGRPIKFAGGTVAPHIIDEGGKADLNGSDPKVLASVLQNSGMDPRAVAELIAKIVDMRGSDRTSSAESSRQGTPKQMRGFETTSQLGDFTDISRADLRAAMPLLTVYNPDGKIDILTASRAVLTAIPDVSAAEVEVILARRDNASNEAIEQLTSMLVKAKTYIKTKSGPAYEVRIDAISGDGRKKTLSAVIAASESPEDPYYVFDWFE